MHLSFASRSLHPYVAFTYLHDIKVWVKINASCHMIKLVFFFTLTPSPVDKWFSCASCESVRLRFINILLKCLLTYLLTCSDRLRQSSDNHRRHLRGTGELQVLGAGVVRMLLRFQVHRRPTEEEASVQRDRKLERDGRLLSMYVTLLHLLN